MECKRNQNLESCTGSYPGCEKKGLCCECVAYHREKGAIPGCFFSPGAEKTFDRSIAKFMSDKG